MEIKDYINEYYKYWVEINAAYDNFAKSCNITSNTMFALSEINSCRLLGAECTVKFICEKLFLPKQTTSAIIMKLSEQGYVTKINTLADKREKNIELTTAGIIYAEDILQKLYNFEENAFIKMKEHERAGMAKCNRIFLQNLTQSKTL